MSTPSNADPKASVLKRMVARLKAVARISFQRRPTQQHNTIRPDDTSSAQPTESSTSDTTSNAMTNPALGSTSSQPLASASLSLNVPQYDSDNALKDAKQVLQEQDLIMVEPYMCREPFRFARGPMEVGAKLFRTAHTPTDNGLAHSSAYQSKGKGRQSDLFSRPLVEQPDATLLGIPLEIRQHIFSFLDFKQDEGRSYSKDGHKTWCSASATLLMVCQQLYYENVDSAYRKYTFELHNA